MGGGRRVVAYFLRWPIFSGGLFSWWSIFLVANILVTYFLMWPIFLVAYFPVDHFLVVYILSTITQGITPGIREVVKGRLEKGKLSEGRVAKGWGDG